MAPNLHSVDESLVIDQTNERRRYGNDSLHLKPNSYDKKAKRIYGNQIEPRRKCREESERSARSDRRVLSVSTGTHPRVQVYM